MNLLQIKISAAEFIIKYFLQEQEVAAREDWAVNILSPQFHSLNLLWRGGTKLNNDIKEVNLGQLRNLVE